MAYNVGLLSTRNLLMICLLTKKKVSELRYYQSQNLDSAEIKTRVVLVFTKDDIFAKLYNIRFCSMSFYFSFNSFFYSASNGIINGHRP